MSAAPRPALSVVVATFNRAPLLGETLTRLAAQLRGEEAEVVVVDDGSVDGSADAATAALDGSDVPSQVVRQDNAGPAAARNRGLMLARGGLCLLLGDDVLPEPGLIDAHLGFHASRPEVEEAALGLVTPAPPLDRSPFVRWLHEDGVQFGYGRLTPGQLLTGAEFWTANVSLKRELLQRAGPFSEEFTGAASEDIELGFRLQRAGMRLRYEPRAAGRHFHPTDLGRTLERAARVGESQRLLVELAPEVTAPRPPGARHRLKAALLTAPALARVRPMALRRATWRFLCDQRQREAYWGRTADGAPIGARLERLARRDPLAWPPTPSAPDGQG